MTNVAIIYYSATGTIFEFAKHAATVAEKAGADVRLRKVRELVPAEAIASNEGWAAHHQATLTRREKPGFRRHYFSGNRPKMG